MHYGVTGINPFLRGSTALGQGLGSLSLAQMDQANDKVSELGARLDRQFLIVDRARGAGFDSAIVQDALAQYHRIFADLGDLTREIPSMDPGAFPEWLARVQGVEQQVFAFEQATMDVLPQGVESRNAKLVIATVGAVGVAAIAAYAWWAYTTPGSILSKRGWRKRRRR